MPNNDEHTITNESHDLFWLEWPLNSEVVDRELVKEKQTIKKNKKETKPAK